VKTQLSMAMLATALVLGGCQKVTSLEVTPATVSLTAAGQSASLAVKILDQNGKVMEGVQLTFTSSSPQIATVDAAGKITAVKSGDATISAAAGEVTKGASVSVRIPAKITVTPSPLAITGIATSAELKGEVADDAGRPIPGATVAFASADPAVAQVAGSVVTSAGAGATKISATFAALRQDVEVTVALPEFATVTLEPAAPTAKVGEAVQLAASAKTAEGAAVGGVPFAFASSDEKIATVDAAGKVTAVKDGTATITAKAGEKTATAKVTIKK